MVTYWSLLAHSLPAFFLDKVKTGLSAARESAHDSFPMHPAWIWEEKGIFFCAGIAWKISMVAVLKAVLRIGCDP